MILALAVWVTFLTLVKVKVIDEPVPLTSLLIFNNSGDIISVTVVPESILVPVIVCPTVIPDVPEFTPVPPILIILGFLVNIFPEPAVLSVEPFPLV